MHLITLLTEHTAFSKPIFRCEVFRSFRYVFHSNPSSVLRYLELRTNEPLIKAATQPVQKRSGWNMIMVVCLDRCIYLPCAANLATSSAIALPRQLRWPGIH